MHLVDTLLKTPTAHSIIDSGDYYGRAYERNHARDFQSEPQALLEVGEYGLSVRVSTYHHLKSQLEEDRLCNEFNALPVEDWNSDFFGVSADGQQWLEDRMFSPEGDAQNSYNWENLFDQVVQYQKLERNGDRYVLLQVHGGCDVRSGYTDAKLFKFDEWDEDSYWMDDRCTFDIERSVLEAAGYVSPDLDPDHGDDCDWVTIEFSGYSGRAEIYDRRNHDQLPMPELNLPKGLRITGSQSAVEH